MIVDDYAGIRKVVGDTLHCDGFRTGEGQETLANRVKMTMRQTLLSDYNMLVPDGYDSLKVVNGGPDLEPAPFTLSASEDNTEKKKKPEIGHLQARVTKPDKINGFTSLTTLWHLSRGYFSIREILSLYRIRTSPFLQKRLTTPRVSKIIVFTLIQ